MSKVFNQKLDKVISQKYLSYAIATIISLYLPDLRDVFKTVNRRIIY